MQSNPFSYTKTLYKTSLWQILAKLRKNVKLTDGYEVFSPRELMEQAGKQAQKGKANKTQYVMLPEGIAEKFPDRLSPFFTWRFIQETETDKE